MASVSSDIFEFDRYRLDVAKRLLTRDGDRAIPLTPKVFDTLLQLVLSDGQVLTKDALLREVWADSVVEENNLNQHISTLRRIFGERPGEHRFIVTVAGHGYRFVPEVRRISDGSNAAIEISTDSLPDSAASQPAGRAWNRRRFPALLLLAVLSCVAVWIYFYAAREDIQDPSVTSVAVLPFKPLVVENRDEALELGMADSLIARLSSDERVVVRPLSAVRRFGSVDQDSLAAGRELGVDSILDGTIQTWGDRIRVTAKLLRASDGRQVWSGQFDEKFTDIFTVQDSISQRVANALQLRLVERPHKHGTENIDAYQLYMRGRYHIAKGAPTDLKASIPYFEQAISLDPAYALAYTGLAHAYGVLGLAGDMTIPDTTAKARAAERRALELDESLGEAHNARCMGIFWYDWDWDAAETECRRAIQIDPNNAEFHGNFAMVLSNTGRHEEALVEAKRARELDPLNLVQTALESQFLMNAGQLDEALGRLKSTSELEPNFWMLHMIAASIYVDKSMFSEAITASDKERELSGRNASADGAYALAKVGRTDEAKTILRELSSLSSTQYVSPYSIATIYNGLNEPDKAIEWLERCYATRDPKMTFLKVDMKWNNLRSDPRFVDLMRRMNFPAV